jgi:hypothetical protein
MGAVEVDDWSVLKNEDPTDRRARSNPTAADIFSGPLLAKDARNGAPRVNMWAEEVGHPPSGQLLV